MGGEWREGGRAAARPVDWAPQDTTAESSPVPAVPTRGPQQLPQHGGGRGGGAQALHSSGGGVQSATVGSLSFSHLALFPIITFPA